jgi:hypothetical protein
MKKGVIAIVLTLMLSVGLCLSMAPKADAITLAIPERGFLIPYVYGDSTTGIDTVAGIVKNPEIGVTETVLWAFFDEVSDHIMDGDFPMTVGDVYLFSWNNAKGFGLDDVPGYLVFASATDTTNLSANALQVLGLQVAAYIPVIPLRTVDLSIVGGQIADVALATGHYAIPAGSDVLMRYALELGLQSTIVCWFDTNPLISITVDMYNLDEANISLELDLPYELTLIDPAYQIGRPASFTDGYYHIGAVETWPEDGIAFTMVANASLTEIQTLLATHYLIVD